MIFDRLLLQPTTERISQLGTALSQYILAVLFTQAVLWLKEMWTRFFHIQ